MAKGANGPKATAGRAGARNGGPRRHAARTRLDVGSSERRGSGRKPRNGKKRRSARFPDLRRKVLRGGAVVGIWLAVVLVGYLAWCAYTLPDLGRATALQRGPSITLLAADGSFLTSFGDLYGTPVKLDDLPPHLPRAVVAIEDRRFFEHSGIDYTGLARALAVNLMAREVRQGGSTITQQLAKNLFLTPDRTLTRKVQEAMLAFKLERDFTKEQILELYLNRVYLGAGAYGVDAAALRYFRKSATDVDLWESAVLAGLLRAPSRLAPTQNPEGAAARARVVLGAMRDLGWITAEAAADPKGVERPLAPTPSGHAIGARYFADWVMEQVQGYLGYVDRDLMVRTTLDPALQAAAVEAVGEAMADRSEQTALVALAPDGAVVAMVGGRDYRASQFNRATQAMRQPGSAFKLFVFLAAMEAGRDPMDRIEDAPVRVGNWEPGNYQDRFLGDVTLGEAMAHSLNSVAVRLTESVGRERVIETARRLGVTADLTREPSLALGTSELPLIELTGAYAAFADEGHAVTPRGIDEIRDSAGRVIYQRAAPRTWRAIEMPVVERINHMLHGVLARGTGRAAALDRQAVGKTGTSQGHRDAWFVGFTADLVAGVWVGNDDNRPMSRVTGGTVPAEVWKAFMERAHAGRPKRAIPGVDSYTPPPRAVAADRGAETSADGLGGADRLRRIFGLQVRPLTPEQRGDGVPRESP